MIIALTSQRVRLQPPTAKELRTNFEKATQSDEASGADNQIYSVNGPAFLYRDHPIQLGTGEPYRVYLVNMLEFDTMNSLSFTWKYV